MRFNPLGKHFDVAVGPVGPAGPQGLPGDAVTYPAGATLGGHRAVTLDGSEQAIYADSSTPGHAGRILGITTGAAAIGAPVTVRTHGAITEPSWTWNVNLPVFLANNGQLAQTQPVSGFSQIVGFPTTADTLFVQIQPPIILS